MKMTVIRKKMPEHNLLPFFLVYKDTKEAQQELPNHLHDWHEIIYIHQGSGTFYISPEFYEVNAGNLLVVPANTVHFTSPNASKLITSTALFFKPELVTKFQFFNDLAYTKLFQSNEEDQSNFFYTFSAKHSIELEHQLSNLNEENIEMGSDYKQAVILQLHLFLIDIHRYSVPNTKNEKLNQTPWIQEAIQFIDSNLVCSLSLEILAKRAAVSSSHFSRVFKFHIGMNINEFIRMKRISLAKKLLSEESDTIEAIARNSGFTSMPHFFRTFKKYTKLTPREFRKKQ